jgi:hypothetical protein
MLSRIPCKKLGLKIVPTFGTWTRLDCNWHIVLLARSNKFVPTDSEQIAEVCSGESQQPSLQISDETATEYIAADTNVLMDITIPSDVPVVDLPLEFVQLESVTPTPKNVEGSETCSSTTALNVVESTMDSATVSRYNKAYNNGRDLLEKKNPLYKSWKYYKDLSQAELSAIPLNTTISLVKI